MDLPRDLQHGVRLLARSPGFTAAAVLTLALGTGAAIAVFSLVYAVVLKPLPYADAERLVMLWEANRERGLAHEPVSPVSFLDYRLSGVFEDAAAWWRPELNLADETDAPMRVVAVETSENLFDVLGVAPVLGRGFPVDETLHGSELEAVISHRLWRARFGGERDVLGRTIRLNGYSYAIVGVMPPGFHFPDGTDVWQRLQWDLSQHNRGARFMGAVARLAPGTPLERVNPALDAVAGRLSAEAPQTNAQWTARAVPLGNDVAGVFRPAFLALLAAAGLLLFAACFNIANLLLARGTVRRPEIAVRAALGASRRRLLLQLGAESVVLALSGGVLGLLLAAAAVRGFLTWTPIEIPRADEVAVNGVVVLFALGTALITAIGFGLAPAWLAARGPLQNVLRAAGRNAGATGGRARGALVVLQVAVAVMLLAGTGLLVRSVRELLRVDTGVRAEGVLVADLQLPDALYADWAEVARLYAGVLDELRADARIDAAGSANFLPLEPGWRVPFGVPGRAPADPNELPMAQYHTIDEGYIGTLGVELVRGRNFDARDDTTRAAVAIVNEAFARRYFPAEDAAGKRVEVYGRVFGPLGARITAGSEHEIVGVVRDVRNAPLDAEVEPALYFPLRQFPFRRMNFFVRARVDDAAAVALLRDAVQRADPTLPVANARPLARVLGAAADPPRLVLAGLGAFAVLALLLAGTGIYGVLSYTVIQRRREIGIRLALGARPSSILGRVVRDGLLLGAAGGALGVAGAVLGARTLASLLFGVTSTDALTLAAVFGVVLAVTFIACALPGRRAAATSPLESLREG
jgi:putative ABC transport system permease protein